MQAEVKNIKGDQRETAAHLAELNEKVNFQYRKSSRGQLSNINLPIKSHLNATKPNDKIFQQFLNSLNPIDKEEWDEDGCFGRFLSILKIPIVVILTLVIPVVDYTWANHGWSKLLNILHIIILPLMLCLSNGWLSISFYGVPVGAYCVLGSLPVCIIVFYTSRTDRPPKYHLAYAVFGSFVGSIVTISTFASEVVAILSTLGVVSNLSNSMLGLSVLAWGNSIGDLMSNVALARQGYTKMGFSACFGGPFFNSIFGMGIVFLLKLYHTGKSAVFARSGAMGVNCSIFLFITLSFTGMIFVCTKFQARRSNGIFLLMLYTCFLASVFLGEFEIVHPYGTDHRNEGDIQ